jgi:replicative DNA helicase
MDLKSLVESRQASSAEILAAAEDVKEAAQAVEQENKPATLSDAVDEYLAHETTPKIETAFAPIDRMCGGGLPVGGLSVFAAPPSVGKSALALQACLGALDVDPSLRVVWCMGEMTMEAMARRATCHWSTRYGQHPVTMASAERRSDLANGSALALKMKVGDRLQLVAPPLSIGKIEDAVVESGARLLVIDYIQLVEMEAADRRAEIDGVVKRIRRLSLERNVAVLAISNIAKGVGADTRIGAIGKESSELDFAADLFLLGDPDPERDQDGNRMVRWMCKKNRHGPCEDIITKFDGQLQTFSDAQVSPVDDFSTWR